MIPIGTIVDLPLPSPFQSRLKFIAIKRESDGEVFVELLAPLRVQTRKGLVEIPTGFISDGASIPKLVRWAAGDPFALAYLPAAIVHDALYRKNFLDHIKRKHADLIFRDLLLNSDVTTWKIPAFYGAVASFGWRSYKKIETVDVIPKAIPIPEP